MKPLDNRSTTDNNQPPGTTEKILEALTQEVESLRQDLSVQLNSDVRWLQGEKTRLMQEIDQLRLQHQQLQGDYRESISEQQLAQQQLWAKQLAQVLAAQLQQQLGERLSGDRALSTTDSAPPALNSHNENVQKVLVSLDSTLNQTFKTLQQDLSSYQSTLSQQLSRMYSMESQGEAILEALVNRLVAQLQGLQPPPAREKIAPLREITPPSEQPAPKVEAKPLPAPKPKPASQLQLGLVFALLASIAFSLQNVVTRIILSPNSLFGIWDVGNLISPGLGNSIFILWLRMLVVVPLVSLLGTNGYQLNEQPFWKDIQNLFQSKDSALKLTVLGSGFFLFLSQTLAYIAFGNLATGLVTALILTYPIVTIFLARLFFGDRLTVFRMVASAIVFAGVVLISTSGGIGGSSNLVLGLSTALGSGITLAFCVIFTQIACKKINPVPFTLVQFGVIFIFSSLFSAFFGWFVPNSAPTAIRFDSTLLPSLLLAGIILGLTTLGSYLFQNIGIRMAGAALYAIIANTGPVITSLIAWLLIQETLEPIQILGMLVVTVGVVALGVKRLRDEKQAIKMAKAR